MLPFTRTTLDTILGAIPSISSEWEIVHQGAGFVELKAPNGDIVTIDGGPIDYWIYFRRTGRTVYPEYWAGVVEVIQDFERSGYKYM